MKEKNPINLEAYKTKDYGKGIKHYETKEGTYISFSTGFIFKPKKLVDKPTELKYPRYISELNFGNLMIDYILFRGYENTEEFKLKIIEQDSLSEFLDPRKKFSRKDHLVNLIKKYDVCSQENGRIIYITMENGIYKLKFSSPVSEINIIADNPSL